MGAAPFDFKGAGFEFSSLLPENLIQKHLISDLAKWLT
jgi:hypothetical protein